MNVYQKTIKKILLGVFFLIYNFSFIYGQNPAWSFEKCLSYTLQENNTIALANLNQERTQLAYKESKLDFLPSVSASGGYNIAIGRSIDPLTNDFTTETISSLNLGSSINLNVFNGFRAYKNLKIRKLNLKRAELHSTSQKGIISIELLEQFINTLFLKEQIHINKQLLQNSKQHESLIKNQIETGVFSGGTSNKEVILNSKADVADSEAKLRNSIVYYNTAIRNLKLMMNYPIESKLQIKDILIQNPDSTQLPTFDYVWSQILQNHPEMKADVIEMETKKLEISLAQSNNYPSLTASYAIGSGYSSALQNSIISPTGEVSFENVPFNEQITNNLNQSIGLSLNIPLERLYKNKSQYKEAQIAYQEEIINQKYEKHRLFNDTQELYLSIMDAYHTYEIEGIKELAAKESFRVINEKRILGLVNYVVFFEVKDQLHQAIIRKNKAKYEYWLRVNRLRIFTGQKIEF